MVSFSGNWTPTQMAPVWKSSDGGLTWRRVAQIPQPQAGLSGPGDQKVAFDSTGRLHVAELGVNGGGTNFDFIFRQTGAADAALTAGASFGDDHPISTSIGRHRAHAPAGYIPRGSTSASPPHDRWSRTPLTAA